MNQQASRSAAPQANAAALDAEMNGRFVFFNDPGHGWLRVSIALCRKLKIRVSGYSYYDGTHLYLEEDADAGIFIKAWEQATGRKWKTQENEIDKYEEQSSVRRMTHGIPADLLKD